MYTKFRLGTSAWKFYSPEDLKCLNVFFCSSVWTKNAFRQKGPMIPVGAAGAWSPYLSHARGCSPAHCRQKN